jgi:glycosyltransferase involved in cell wall biosynthesis
VVLVPSRSEESGSYAILDAFAAGVPVLGSSRGGVGELVGETAALDPEEPGAWTEALRALWEAPGRRQELGEELITRSRRRLGEDGYYERLLAVYGGD